MSDIVSRHVSSLSINTVITFDRHGVSSHKNHISLYYALACLALEVTTYRNLTFPMMISKITLFVLLMVLRFGSVGLKQPIKIK